MQRPISSYLSFRPSVKGLFRLILPLVGLLWVLPVSASNLLQAVIDAAVDRGQSTVRIPPGRYEVSPSNGVHLALNGLRDIAIDARDVEMVCTETTLAISVNSCRNLRIVGLTIDYDPLPFTQGRIVEISEDRKSHVIEIMDGFPPAEDAYVFKHAVYTPKGELRFGSYYQFKLEVLSTNRLRIFGLHPKKDGGEQVGDIVVVGAEHLKGPYRAHAIDVRNSVGTEFDGIKLYSSPCFGFLEVASSRSVYRNCLIDRREGRVRSLNADAFHSKHAEIGPRIINCKAMWQGDDCVNICGDYYLVESGEGRNWRVLTPRFFHLKPGDPVELVTPEGKRLPDAEAVSAERAGDITASDKEFFNTLNLNPKVKDSFRSAYSIELDREVDLPAGSILASINRKGNGFAVTNCTFGNNRSRGILIKASEGEVSRNYLVQTHMEAIKISPEYHWLESGFSRNVVVESNLIVNPSGEAISIKGIGPFPGHENLQVVNNLVQTKVHPAIKVDSVRKGRVVDNEVLGMDGGPVNNTIQVRYSEDLSTQN